MTTRIRPFVHHRRALLAALGLLTPACTVDESTDLDPVEDAGSTGDALPRPGRSDGRAADALAADAMAGAGDAMAGAGDAMAGAGDAMAGAGGVDGAVRPPRCEDPRPILQVGSAEAAPTGFVECANGSINRVVAEACADPMPPGRACAGEGGSCIVDADCTAAPYGRCLYWGVDAPACQCVYGCKTDADCAEGTVCMCGGIAGDWYPEGAICIPADCRTDADCGEEGCGLSAFETGCGYDRWLTCRTAQDTCNANRDCDESRGGGLCLGNRGSAWTCTYGSVCGRPFRVEGRALVAPHLERADWCGAPHVASAERLGRADRERLAAYCLELAALEHASVASFARFALDLMVFGAPPKLLADTAAAMTDEVAHACALYTLATAYGGRPVGPGALPLPASTQISELHALVFSVIREACVGELLGACEAECIAAWAVDPAVRSVFARIAEDERRHAELGWRSLQWLLTLPGAPGAAEVSRVFDAAVADFAHPDGAAEDRLLSHGLPSAETRREIFAAATRDVIGPCVERLLAHLEAAVRAA